MPHSFRANMKTISLGNVDKKLAKRDIHNPQTMLDETGPGNKNVVTSDCCGGREETLRIWLISLIQQQFVQFV